jgi:Domain of unknown function (DUF4926)
VRGQSLTKLLEGSGRFFEAQEKDWLLNRVVTVPGAWLRVISGRFRLVSIEWIRRSSRYQLRIHGSNPLHHVETKRIVKFPLYSRVAPAVDLPGAGLRRGDVATTVEYYEGDGSENGYDLEVFNALGHTVAVVNVLESQLEALRDDELLTVRQHELTAS